MQTRKRPTCKTLKDLLFGRLFGRIRSVQNHETQLFLSEISNRISNISWLLKITSNINTQKKSIFLSCNLIDQNSVNLGYLDLHMEHNFIFCMETPIGVHFAPLTVNLCSILSSWHTTVNSHAHAQKVLLKELWPSAKLAVSYMLI